MRVASNTRLQRSCVDASRVNHLETICTTLRCRVSSFGSLAHRGTLNAPVFGTPSASDFQTRITARPTSQAHYHLFQALMRCCDDAGRFQVSLDSPTIQHRYLHHGDNYKPSSLGTCCPSHYTTDQPNSTLDSVADLKTSLAAP